MIPRLRKAFPDRSLVTVVRDPPALPGGQAVDLTDADFVRAQLRLRVPESTPTGWRWVVSVRVDGSPLAQATCAPGRERVLTDLAANVSKLAGVQDVAIRLALEEV
ncbi:MAG: hypothetical protein AAF845_15895 [Bacteroidota bacterium]